MNNSEQKRVPTPELLPLEEAAARKLYQEYDRQRQLRLVATMARFLCLFVAFLAVVATVVLLANGVFRANPLLAFAGIGAMWLVAALLGTGFWAARQGRLHLARALVPGMIVTVTCFSAVFLNAFGQTQHNSLLPGFFALSIGIVVVGLLGNLRAIIGTTLFINTYTLLAFLFIIPRFTGQPLVQTRTNLPFLGIIIFAQWGIAALMSLGWLNYQQTFRDLGAAQIAVERARQLDDLKDQFISSVNHELRNPLMAMMNYVTVLSQRHEAMTAARRTQVLGALEQTGKAVIKLVGSILDVRQIDQRPETYAPTAVPLRDVLQIAAGLIDPAEARMGERDLLLSVPVDLEIWGNETYLQQIFTNLISNAVKYSEPGTPIQVRAISGTATSKGKQTLAATVEVTVRDYGLGIPPDQIPLLFNRFVRLSRDLTSQVSGNGLGLYLCKVLTEAMGGRIWVESSGIAGEGSTFHLSLPSATGMMAENAKDHATDEANTLSRHDATSPNVRIVRGRVALGGILAALVIVGGSLAFAQNRNIATSNASGMVQFVDDQNGHSNGLSMTVADLPTPPAGAHYQAWLIDAANEQILSLGSLVAQQHGDTLTYQSSDAAINLLGMGDRVEITQERGQAQAPLGKVVLLGVFPPQTFVHIRHLMVSFPGTPGNQGLLVGLLGQVTLLDSEAHQLSAASQNATLSHCLVLSMLSIVEGQQGAHASAFPTACQRLHIVDGDGYGLLPTAASPSGGYLDDSAAHATLAIQQPDVTTAIRAQGERLVATLETIQEQTQDLDAALISLLKAPSGAMTVTNIVALADQLDSGTAGAANPAAGGTHGAYTAGQLMARLPLTAPTT